MIYFNTPTFIIAVRETMEAALIVSIIMAYLTKTNNNHLKKTVWTGVILAVITSIISALVLNIFFQGLNETNEKLMEGVIFIITAAMLSWVILIMHRHGRYLGTKLENKMEIAMSQGGPHSLFFLVYFAVLREGIETVLFMIGVGVSDIGSALFSGVIGIALAIVVATLFFNGTLKLDLKVFFNITSILLIFFAAGLFAYAFHEFQELGWFGGEQAFINQQFLDLSGVLNDKENGFGVMMRALFGYQDKPTWLELLAYASYWLFIYLSMITINRKIVSNKVTTTA